MKIILNNWVNSRTAKIWDENGDYVPRGKAWLYFYCAVTVGMFILVCVSVVYFQKCPLGTTAGMTIGSLFAIRYGLIILSPPAGSDWSKSIQKWFLRVTSAMSVSIDASALIILALVHHQMGEQPITVHANCTKSLSRCDMNVTSLLYDADFFARFIPLLFSIALLACSEFINSKLALSAIPALMTSSAEEHNTQQAFEYSYCWKAYKTGLKCRIIVLFFMAAYADVYNDWEIFNVLSTGIILYLGYVVGAVAELPVREYNARRDISEHVGDVLAALSSSSSYHETLPPLALKLDAVLKKDILGRPRGTNTLADEQTRCAIMRDIDVVIHSPKGFPLCAKETCPVRQVIEAYKESVEQTQDECNFVQSMKRLQSNLSQLQKSVQQ